MGRKFEISVSLPCNAAEAQVTGHCLSTKSETQTSGNTMSHDGHDEFLFSVILRITSK
jgi:hypothetical protein